VSAKTAFILCYDENDGLFDHVVPPTSPAGTPDEFVQGEPIGLDHAPEPDEAGVLRLPRASRRTNPPPFCISK
jgi:phospholipase C